LRRPGKFRAVSLSLEEKTRRAKEWKQDREVDRRKLPPRNGSAKLPLQTMLIARVASSGTPDNCEVCCEKLTDFAA
jgi:hypothetical protein